MLLEFGFKNFFSFREGAQISFKLDANCPTTISEGEGYSTVIGIKGANGAGKTQVLKALAFLVDFCKNSFNKNPAAQIEVASFFNNEDPIEFYVDFISNNKSYKYELVCTAHLVLSETIFIKNKKQQKIIERNKDGEINATKKYEAIKKIKLRHNASLISTSNQYEIDEIIDIYKFFEAIAANVNVFGLSSKYMDIDTISSYLKSNIDRLNFVSQFISECDTGISNIVIANTKNEKQEDKFYPLFVHEYEGFKLNLIEDFESSGTKTLYKMLPLYNSILQLGGVLILDEFDINLHPFIAEKLLNLFVSKKTNPKNAQLIFTTHDEKILDLLGRYRIYMVNKNDNQSYTYRLDEIQGDILRNDRSILPAYNSGKIGGVPRL